MRECAAWCGRWAWMALVVACGKDDPLPPPPPPPADCLAGAEVQAAIDEASGGETFTICSGSQGVNLVVDLDLVLVGDGTTLDGGGLGPVIQVEEGVTLELRDLTLTGGGGDPLPVAGAVDALLAAGLVVRDCVVEDNEGETGGIAARDPVEIFDSQITGNRGTVGGLTVRDAILDGVDISGNTGTFNAGGVQVLPGGSVQARNGTAVSGNSSGFYGGGASLMNGSTWIGGSFTGNAAANTGGGVLIWEPEDILLQGVSIQSNTAVENGGGVGVLNQGQGSVRLADLQITANAALRGGGVHSQPGSHVVSMEAVELVGNDANFGGGLAYNGLGAGFGDVVRLDAASVITDNTSLRGAGILLEADNVTVTLDGAQVARNDAENAGGGAVIDAGTLVSVGGDWGEGDDNNKPDDIVMGLLTISGLGADESFTCSAALSTCQ